MVNDGLSGLQIGILSINMQVSCIIIFILQDGTVFIRGNFQLIKKTKTIDAKHGIINIDEAIIWITGACMSYGWKKEQFHHF